MKKVARFIGFGILGALWALCWFAGAKELGWLYGAHETRNFWVILGACMFSFILVLSIFTAPTPAKT